MSAPVHRADPVMSCRLAGYKDVPVSSHITSLVSMPLFDSNSPAQSGPMVHASQRRRYLARRSYSAPSLEQAISLHSGVSDTSNTCPEG